MKVLVEACVDSVAAARQAAAAGAARLELCQDLLEDGTTPGRDLLAAVRRRVRLPLHVLIRPRGGDFCYGGDELAAMRRDIALARRLGAQGVALGALDREGRIDRERTGELVALARPLAVTFHRAFDRVPDAAEALEVLLALGVERVLTSGLATSAAAGAAALAALVRQASGRIGILAAGRIRSANVARLVAATGVREVHLRAGPQARWVRGVVSSLRASPESPH